MSFTPSLSGDSLKARCWVSNSPSRDVVLALQSQRDRRGPIVMAHYYMLPTAGLALFHAFSKYQRT